MSRYGKHILEPHRAFIAELINQTPHLTLRALKAEFAASRVKVSYDTI